MLLKNFYEIFRNISTTCNLKNVSGTSVSSKYMYFNSATTINGVNYRIIANKSTADTTANGGYNQLGVMYGNVASGNPEGISNFGYMGMAMLGLGTDDTPVTYEDYKLGNIVALPQTQYNIVNIVENGEHIGLGYTTNINNNTGADVEIKEVGLYTGLYNNSKPFLIYREVLETPITIPNGQSVVVTMRLM